MVEAQPQQNFEDEGEDYDSEDLDEAKLEQMKAFSNAANMKLQGTGVRRSATVRAPSIEDAAHTATFNQEVAYLKEQVHEAGYNTASETLQKATQEQINQWNEQKQLLLQKDAVLDHASQKIALSYKGLVVDHKLDQLRKKMIANDHSLLIGEYYDKLDSMVNSPLFDCFKMMPKPAVHHAHLTACADLDFLLKLTYKDCVYYSQKANEFHVSAKGCSKEGFIKVNSLRQYWKNARDFDKYLKDKMALKPPASAREDHAIWQGFQFKFQLTFQLYNYKSFFERILYRVTRDFMIEGVAVVEYRHILGCLFDDDGAKIPLAEELAIFQDCIEKIQLRFPLFRMKLIICGLKLFGRDHIQSQLDDIIEANSQTNLISGFDMVNEEDYNPPIDDFLDQIMAVKMKLGDRFQLYLHAGETYNRENTELFDAILLGTKRIGHGFGLTMNPNLMERVKQENICIEACPVSNKILGYVHDMRTHPTRSLLAHGVKVSISPDDHGFFGSPGVTLDFLMAYLCWDLNLMDLKQLCLNSIEFASISEADKVSLRKFFDYKWQVFLAYVRGKY